MATDFSSLKKMEPLPAKLLADRVGTENVVILLKLKEDQEFPSYVKLRTKISSQIFSAELLVADLQRLDQDPAVHSFSLSRALPVLG